MIKNNDFVKNFKICYIKEEEILYSNQNLIFNLDEENDIYLKKYNFIREISGRDVRPVGQVKENHLSQMTSNESLKMPSNPSMVGETDRLKSESINLTKGKRKVDPIISNKQLQKT